MICGQSWYERGCNQTELNAWRVYSAIEVVLFLSDYREGSKTPSSMESWAIDRAVDAWFEIGGLM